MHLQANIRHTRVDHHHARLLARSVWVDGAALRRTTEFGESRAYQLAHHPGIVQTGFLF